MQSMGEAAGPYLGALGAFGRLSKAAAVLALVLAWPAAAQRARYSMDPGWRFTLRAATWPTTTPSARTRAAPSTAEAWPSWGRCGRACCTWAPARTGCAGPAWTSW